MFIGFMHIHNDVIDVIGSELLYVSNVCRCDFVKSEQPFSVMMLCTIVSVNFYPLIVILKRLSDLSPCRDGWLFRANVPSDVVGRRIK